MTHEAFTYYILKWRDASGNVREEYETQDPDDAEYMAGEWLSDMLRGDRLELTKEVF